MSTHDRKYGKIALEWWRSLQPQTDENGKTTNRGDPGALARLRRAASPVQALAEARTIELAHRLDISPRNARQLASVGALAAVLAHVRGNNNEQHMAALLGPDRNGENAAMSPLRFRRLLAAKTPAELMRQMRNAVKLLRGTANVRNLAEAMLHWNDDTRIRWTYEYWGAGAASPDATTRAINAQHEETAQ